MRESLFLPSPNTITKRGFLILPLISGARSTWLSFSLSFPPGPFPPLTRSFSLSSGESRLSLRFGISMAAATNEITLLYTRYEISIAFMGLLPANMCVKPKARDYHWLKYRLMARPSPLSSSSLPSTERRVYGLKHRVSLRAAPAFSLGDYENSDVIVRASYIVRSSLTNVQSLWISRRRHLPVLAV